MNISPRPLLLAATLAIAGCNGSGGDAEPTTSTGVVTESLAYQNATGAYRALVHMPPGAAAGATALPLYVMVHGCATTAEQQQSANLLDALADQERFVVLYPDYDPKEAGTDAKHPLKCWRFYNATEQQRGVGDNDAIAGLTRLALAKYHLDPDRVYLVGMSSGAFEASIMGATYPDLYAAIGIVAGGPYGSSVNDAFQPAGPEVAQPAVQAQAARQAMGINARPLPFIVIHGDQDTTIYPRNGVNAVQQWLMTNNLVASGTATTPYPLTATILTPAAVPGGYGYQIGEYKSVDGCAIARFVTIAGMNHFWPGGTTDPAFAAFTDPKGPSGARLTWDYLRQFRRSTKTTPCAQLVP